MHIFIRTEPKMRRNQSGLFLQAGRKLRSRRGLSLLLALLFFLVCAATGSIILAAGTASVGRLAGLKESEQRYASVSSAALLLQKEIRETTVVLEQVDTRTAVETTGIIKVEGDDYGFNDGVSYNLGSSVSTTYGTPTLKELSGNAEKTNTGFLTAAVEGMELNPGSVQTLELNINATGVQAVKAEVKLYPDDSGNRYYNLEATIYNAEGERFIIGLKGTPVVVMEYKEDDPVKYTESVPQTEGEYNQIITETTTTRKTTTTSLRWIDVTAEVLRGAAP